MIFRNGPTLKDYLVRLAFPRMINSRGSDLCEIGTYQACGHITTTNTFTTKVCVEVFKIQNGSLNCNSEKALYLLRCKVYDDTPYIRKAKTNLCLRFNNCKSEHRFCVFIMSHMRSLYYFVVVWLSWSYLKFKWSLWYLKFKWLQQDSNPKSLSSSMNTQPFSQMTSWCGD